MNSELKVSARFRVCEPRQDKEPGAALGTGSYLPFSPKSLHFKTQLSVEALNPAKWTLHWPTCRVCPIHWGCCICPSVRSCCRALNRNETWWNVSEIFTQSWSMEWTPEETPKPQFSGQERTLLPWGILNIWNFSLFHNDLESYRHLVDGGTTVPHKEELCPIGLSNDPLDIQVGEKPESRT